MYESEHAWERAKEERGARKEGRGGREKKINTPKISCPRVVRTKTAILALSPTKVGQ